MKSIVGSSADEVWRQAFAEMHTQGLLQDSRDQPTRELLHVSFTITDPRQRLVFARPLNPAFALAEVIWILSGSNSSEFVEFWNSRMVRYTDTNPTILHGAYGFRLGSQPTLSKKAEARLRIAQGPTPFRIDQLKRAQAALDATPHSRQVVLQIWDHAKDLPNPEPQSRDIPCNIVSHLMIRQNKLEWLQVMRSNDLMWGTPYNIIQFTTLQEIVAGWLGVDVGHYCHISDSLHTYQRHWETESVSAPARTLMNTSDLRIHGYSQWEALWSKLVDRVLDLMDSREPREIGALGAETADFPSAYGEWIAVLAAEALRKLGADSLAHDLIDKAGAYWSESWRRWCTQQLKRG